MDIYRKAENKLIYCTRFCELQIQNFEHLFIFHLIEVGFGSRAKHLANFFPDYTRKSRFEGSFSLTPPSLWELFPSGPQRIRERSSLYNIFEFTSICCETCLEYLLFSLGLGL